MIYLFVAHYISCNKSKHGIIGICIRVSENLIFVSELSLKVIWAEIGAVSVQCKSFNSKEFKLQSANDSNCW